MWQLHSSKNGSKDAHWILGYCSIIAAQYIWQEARLPNEDFSASNSHIIIKLAWIKHDPFIFYEILLRIKNAAYPVLEPQISVGYVGTFLIEFRKFLTWVYLVKSGDLLSFILRLFGWLIIDCRCTKTASNRWVQSHLHIAVFMQTLQCPVKKKRRKKERWVEIILLRGFVFPLSQERNRFLIWAESCSSSLWF